VQGTNYGREEKRRGVAIPTLNSARQRIPAPAQVRRIERTCRKKREKKKKREEEREKERERERERE